MLIIAGCVCQNILISGGGIPYSGYISGGEAGVKFLWMLGFVIRVKNLWSGHV